MWYVVGGIAVALVLLFLLLWLRNIAKAVKSGDFEQRLKEMRGEGLGDALEEHFKQEQEKANMAPNPTPDRPLLQGRHGPWIAVKADDAGKVSAALDLADARPCNWESASTIVSSFGNERLFVSGAVDGWVFLVGALPDPHADAPQNGLWQFLVSSSRAFGDAQYFFFSSTVMVNAWARAVDGEMVRAYYFAAHEEEPVIIWNDGKITDGERAADCVFGESGYKGTVPDEEVEDHPDCCLFEEAVGAIAEQWSLDPDSLFRREDLSPSAGVLGRLRSLAVKGA